MRPFELVRGEGDDVEVAAEGIVFKAGTVSVAWCDPAGMDPEPVVFFMTLDKARRSLENDGRHRIQFVALNR